MYIDYHLIILKVIYCEEIQSQTDTLS